MTVQLLVAGVALSRFTLIWVSELPEFFAAAENLDDAASAINHFVHHMITTFFFFFFLFFFFVLGFYMLFKIHPDSRSDCFQVI